MQSNKKSFKGQNIFIGIDVHKSTWSVAVVTESGLIHKHSQNASAQVLFDFLRKHFPDGSYHAVYESGFSGFSTYYALRELGIDCMVIHAADVPTTQYESVMKSDRIDAEKLARSLRGRLLTGVYIREKENLDDRSVIRIRKKIQKQLGGYKSSVKHLLYCNGVEYPDSFERSQTHWSKAFIKWLKEDVRLLSSTRRSLDLLILQVESLRGNLLQATRLLREMSQTEKYRRRYDLLRTIPGIGPIVSMCLLTEVYDISRFRNQRQFASYLGLVPTCHSSGERITNGEKTFRGNKMLGPMIVEASWISIHKDYGLGYSFAMYKKRMESQEAIIRIARKLSNIIFSVLTNEKEYEPYKWE